MNKDDATNILFELFPQYWLYFFTGKNHYMEFFLEIILSSTYLLSAYYVPDIMLSTGLFWSRIFGWGMIYVQWNAQI